MPSLDTDTGLLVDQIIDAALTSFAADFLSRVRGRIAMNKRTAEMHPSEAVRNEATVRLDAYRLVEYDLEHFAKQWFKDKQRELRTRTAG